MENVKVSGTFRIVQEKSFAIHALKSDVETMSEENRLKLYEDIAEVNLEQYKNIAKKAVDAMFYGEDTGIIVNVVNNGITIIEEEDDDYVSFSGEFEIKLPEGIQIEFPYKSIGDIDIYSLQNGIASLL